MVRISLHTKFLALILGTLVFFLAILSLIIVQREANLLADKIEEQQHVIAATLFSQLKSNMLKGTPRSTIELLTNLQGKHGLVQVSILRRDGNPAFGMIGKFADTSRLEGVFATGEDTSYQEDWPDPRHTILFPLRNDQECRSCHQRDGDVLGVLRITLSRKEALEEIQSGSRQLAATLLLLAALVGVVLYAVIRSVVLKPLAALQAGAVRIGGGDLNHRIAVKSRDELHDLASAFNVMAERLEESHAGLEDRIRERTAQVHAAMEDAKDKASRLYAYARDMATVSRLSTRVFSAEITLDALLDSVVWGVTRGLGYHRAAVCLIDRKRVWLDVKRNIGMAEEFAPERGLSLLADDPLARAIRTGAPVKLAGNGGGMMYVIPLLSRKHGSPCHEIMSCVKTDCPAYAATDTPCWLTKNTQCGSALRESYADQLAFCMTCRVFPVLGALVVDTVSNRHVPRGRNLGVLRILAAETAAALENLRLHEANQRMVGELLELHGVTAAALSELSLSRAVEAFTESAMKFSGLDACTFWLVSTDGTELLRAAGGCLDPDESLDGCPERLPIEGSLIGRAFKQGNSFVIDTNVEQNDPTDFAAAAARHGLHSLLAIPIRSEEGPRGVLAIHKKGTTPFLETEITAFMLLANQASLAVNVCILNEELKNQNSELARQSSLLGGILSNMSSGIMLLDATGRVSFVNQLGAAILRSRREELLGRNLFEQLPETSVFAEADTGVYRELDVLAADGSRVPVGFSSASYLGTSAEHEGTIVVYRDLSEIRALQKELLGKERFAAVGRVVAGVAHEIRNPLFGISSVGQILARQVADPGHQELIRALLAETGRMNQLVEELLMYGRPMQLQREECDLAKIWDDVLVMHREELDQRGIRLDGDLHARKISAFVDRHQIRQVFLNVFRNAVDAMPNGGELGIRFLLGSRFVVLQITDTGGGIPAELQEKIFDLFFTTKPKGTGLGLGICRKIVQDHGGDMGVDSVEGKGTAVTIRLPYGGDTAVVQ
jgi:signal transduction histidine kinase/HAMP domain-containing protein